jgi:glutathione S-transferase
MQFTFSAVAPYRPAEIAGPAMPANDAENFVLRSTETSPFGRKVRMAIEVLGLNARIAMQVADTLDENDTLRQQNPLGKMPCLLLADGTALYDSGVIIEFLQEIAGSEALVPPSGAARYQTLTLAKLADGITDAALLMVYEGRFRDPGTQSERWLAHQRGKAVRALAAFEAAPPDPAKTDIVAIGLSCALAYLDWRRPVKWRDNHPRLVTWLAAFARHEPAFERTRATNA